VKDTHSLSGVGVTVTPDERDVPTTDVRGAQP